MGESQTRRVVLVTGEVREVVVYRDDSDSPYSVSTHRWCAGGMRSRTAHGAVVSAMSLGDEPVREILAPNEPTRAELAAQLAAVTRELAVARAQQAPLVACVDALRAAATSAGWRDADATGETLVAWVRRGGACKGAEAVRDAAMSVADDLAGDVPEASDCEWAHELMHRVAAAVARVQEGGE